MRKDKSFRFTTDITPETEILLTGRKGQPLSMSLDDGRSPKTVRLDTESVIRLQAFLSDYLQEESSVSTAPEFRPTGRALAVMDGDTLDIVRVFRTGKTVGLGESEADSYTDLCDKVRRVADMELPKRPVFIFFDTYDGSIRSSVINRILKACISRQWNFVHTGDFFRCHRMVLESIEESTSIDASIISRATRNVAILSPAGTFTLNSADGFLDTPSLFDEGARTVDGRMCGRKAVLAVLRDAIAGEDKADPFTDEELSDLLQRSGYAVARRTVSKYRDMLGIPKRAVRRSSVSR